VRSPARRWNCPNCGRSNKTVLARDGTADCEYCTDGARVSPLEPFGSRLVRLASGFLSGLGRGAARGRSEPVLARTKPWDRPTRRRR
jgi:hypothetical protein